MFPISWNSIFRKKDGSLTSMDEAISAGGGGGGGESLPPHSEADAGKVLGVTNDGSLAWIEVSGGGGGYSRISNVLVPDVNITTTAEEVTT